MEWIFGAIGLGLPLLQTQTTHNEALRQADVHHDQALRLDIELARRDILQEMRDQKADKLETLMVMDSLMLGCCFAIVVEGIPPRHSWRLIINVFAVTLSSSFCLFFLSVWFVMKVQSRMNRYNILNPKHPYPCGKQHGSFHSFYMCHCHAMSKVAVGCYYAGVVAIILTAALLFYSRFMLRFRVPEAAVIFAAVCIMFLLLLVVMEYQFPTGPRLTEKDYQGHHSLASSFGRGRMTPARLQRIAAAAKERDAQKEVGEEEGEGGGATEGRNLQTVVEGRDSSSVHRHAAEAVLPLGSVAAGSVLGSSEDDDSDHEQFMSRWQSGDRLV